MKNKTTSIVSWLMVAWITKVFLTSIPYKFSQAPETQYIFNTIGTWLKDFFGPTIGQGFSDYGAYVIGSFEILVSITLLLPGIIWGLNQLNLSTKRSERRKYHAMGGIGASAVMGGAIFFHLFSPLGINIGDGGSLFYAAVSIFFFGIALFLMNRRC